MKRRPLSILLGAIFILSSASNAFANPPVEHELIQPDPRDDLALKVLLDGDLPAALDTRSGVLHAPDPRAPTAPNDPAFGTGQGPVQSDPDAKFTPDRDTRRPDVSPSDDPFTPSIAPFERLAAYDAIHADYTLAVESPALVALSARSDIAHDGSEEQFSRTWKSTFVPAPKFAFLRSGRTRASCMRTRA